MGILYFVNCKGCKHGLDLGNGLFASIDYGFSYKMDNG